MFTDNSVLVEQIQNPNYTWFVNCEKLKFMVPSLYIFMPLMKNPDDSWLQTGHQNKTNFDALPKTKK